MREDDKKVFGFAARAFNAWILVRDTNPSSLKYIGRKGFAPKPIDCKAKTADSGENAGLVVAFDAVFLEKPYAPKKVKKAAKSWNEFAQSQGAHDSISLNRINGRYKVDLNKQTKRYGCVMLRAPQGWCYIHGDYDLKDIIPEENSRQNVALRHRLYGQQHMRDPLLSQVQEFVNSRIGVDMVQHGAEAQYAGHTDDIILVFSPFGDERVLRNEVETTWFYRALSRPIVQEYEVRNRAKTPQKRRERYGVMKIDVYNHNCSAPDFEDFAIHWFERKFGRTF